LYHIHDIKSCTLQNLILLSVVAFSGVPDILHIVVLSLLAGLVLLSFTNQLHFGHGINMVWKIKATFS